MIIWGFILVLPIVGILGGFWLFCYMVNRDNKVLLNSIATGSIVCCVSLYFLFNYPLSNVINTVALENPAAYQRLHRIGLQAGLNDLAYFWNVLVLLIWLSIPASIIGAIATLIINKVKTGRWVGQRAVSH